MSDELKESRPDKNGKNPKARSQEPPPQEPPPTREACGDLVVLARQAFQEKRRKDSLALTRVILSIDPENKEAQVIESWVQADLEKDLDESRAVLYEANQKNDGELFQRAEWMLRAILRVDPNNREATTLLQEIRPSASGFVPPEGGDIPNYSSSDGDMPPTELMEDYPGYPPPPTNRQRTVILIVAGLALPLAGWILWKYFPSAKPPSAVMEVPAAADPKLGILDISLSDGVQVFINEGYRGTTPLEPMKLIPNTYRLKYILDGKEVGREEVTVTAGNLSRNSFRELQGRLEFVIVPAAGVQLKIDGKPIGPVPESAKVNPGQHQLQFSADGYEPYTLSVYATAGERTTVPALLKAIGGAGKPNTPASTPVITSDVGTLDITSPIPVDIYEKGQPLGTTPKILELSTGTHTLEYRFEGLRKSGTYTIQKGVSATAKVTFEIRVNIQASPFANVSIDGDPPLPLGETPLNQVTVPVGGTLIFKYANLPEKRYRVVSTDSDKAISIRFP